MQVVSANVERTHEVACQLAGLLKPGDVVLLNGDLGAGKTHFAQGVGAGLGVAEPITSPTFNLVFQYASGSLPLYHFDLYRLDDPSQLEDIDFYSLTDASSDGVSLIEWSDRFPDEMPEDCLVIAMSACADGARTIAACASGPRSSELLSGWRLLIAR